MSHYSLITLLMFTGAVLAAPPDISKVVGPIAVTSAQPAGNVTSVNGPIRVEDKGVVTDASAVNGSVTLGAGASARSVHTVNGAITLGSAAFAQSLSTVNGSISVGAGGRVAGSVGTVNGSVTLERGADVAGHVSTVNGRIGLDAAHVGAGMETVAGGIEIGASSRVEGGILIKCSRGWWDWLFSTECRPARVVVGPDAVVQGTLRFEREVKLYVSNRARIGPVVGAKAIVYTGDHPPL